MKKLSNYDKDLIKMQYGSLKNYKLKKELENKNTIARIKEEEKEFTKNALNGYMQGLKEQKEIKELQSKKIEIKNKLSATKNYQKWIIIYDLLNGSYYEIKANLLKEKITLNDVKSAVNDINNIHNILNEVNVLEYIKVA